MAKKKKLKQKELTLRIPEGDILLDRLEWAELNRKDLSTRNAVLKEALENWVKSMETRFGPDPRVAAKPKLVSR